jgi:hypothetical protein
VPVEKAPDGASDASLLVLEHALAASAHPAPNEASAESQGLIRPPKRRPSRSESPEGAPPAMQSLSRSKNRAESRAHAAQKPGDGVAPGAGWHALRAGQPRVAMRRA